MSTPKTTTDEPTFTAITGFIAKDAAGRVRTVPEGAIVNAGDPLLAVPYAAERFVRSNASDAERGMAYGRLLAAKHAANPRRHVPDKSWREQEEPARWQRPHLPDRLFNSPKRVRRETPAEEQSA